MSATEPKNARSRRTRTALLTAARELVEQQGVGALTIGAAAERAGCSRRAVYLHFSSRTEFLLALFGHVAEVEDLSGSLLPVREALAAGDAGSALDEWTKHLARYTPRIRLMAHAVDAVARSDSDAGEYQLFARTGQHEKGREVVTALEREGRLTAGMTVTTGADLLFALSGYELFERLTIDRGWPAESYATHLASVLRATLVAE